MLALILIAVIVFAYIAGVMSAINWANQKIDKQWDQYYEEVANEKEEKEIEK